MEIVSGFVASRQESEVVCIAFHAERYTMHLWLSGFMRVDNIPLQPYRWYHLVSFCHCLLLLHRTSSGCLRWQI